MSATTVVLCTLLLACVIADTGGYLALVVLACLSAIHDDWRHDR